MRRSFQLGLMALAIAGATSAADEPAYPHKSFKAERFGTGARSYWLYEPAEPRPEKAPVVAFHHGWLAVNPGVYGAWIEHLARSGNIVVFPRYQADWTTRPAEFLPNAAAAIRDALDVLDGAPDRVRPDRERFALIGHSAGGNLSALMAAAAEDEDLPRPKAVIALVPGEVRALQGPSLAAIPARTLLVVVAAEHDLIVGDHRARQIYAGASAVPASRKEYILYRTDRRGPISLVADHLAPTAGLARLDSGEGPMRLQQMDRAVVDVLDRWGFWRIADLTMAAAFRGDDLDGTSPRFADLGRWGDGRTVLSPIVGDDLEAIPRVFPPNGPRLIPWRPEEFARKVGLDRP